MSASEVKALFNKYDNDKNGVISFDEFVQACHSLIVASTKSTTTDGTENNEIEIGFATSAFKTIEAGDEEEEEEMPHEIAQLPAEEQQSAIKKRAFTMLFIGTLLVLIFSGMEFMCTNFIQIYLLTSR